MAQKQAFESLALSGASIVGGLEVTTSQTLDRGESWGEAGSSWAGSEILLHLIICKKYVRKW